MSEPEREQNVGAPSAVTPSAVTKEFGAPQAGVMKAKAFGWPPRLKRKKNRWLRSLVALIAAGLAMALLQWMAPEFDHQIANIVTIVLGLMVVIYVVFQAHRSCADSGHAWYVPSLVAALVIGFFVLCEPDGFSGEMVPQFRFRFAKKPELKKTVAAEPAAAEPDSEVAVALTDSPQFLGPRRNGVFADRQFSVPESATDVQVLWDQGIGSGWSAFAVAGDRAVTLEQRDQQECVTCYRLADGELLWMQSHEAYHHHPLGGEGPRSTPTIVGDKVYAQGSTGRLWCLELDSGEIVWSVDLLEEADWTQLESDTAIAWGRAASPLMVDDLCVVPFGTQVDLNNPQRGRRSLIALDADNGEVRWKAGSDQISYASPMLITLAGQEQIVSVNEKTITGHQVDDGSVLWEFAWLGASNSNANCTSVVPAGQDRFLIGKGYGGGSALVEISKDAEDDLEATAVWESSRVLKTKFTHACVDGDVAYALSDGSLQAVSVADGDRLWMQPRSGRFGQGQVLLAGDVIIGQAEAGEVVFVSRDPKKYDELIRLPGLSSKTWNIPTLAGRHLLVRNDRRAICYLLPK